MGGKIKSLNEENLPSWIAQLNPIDQIWLKSRIIHLEEMVPSIVNHDVPEEVFFANHYNIIKVIETIIDQRQWSMFRETFIVLNRAQLTFPIFFLPDLLKTSDKVFSKLMNVLYLLPSWVTTPDVERIKNKDLSQKLSTRWEQRLSILSKKSSESLSFAQYSWLAKHEINNQNEWPSEWIEKAWKSANQNQKFELISQLPKNAQTESFLLKKMKTRSATLHYWLIFRLVNLQLNFCTTFNGHLSYPESPVSMDASAWPESTTQLIRQLFHLNEEESLDMVLPLISPKLISMNFDHRSDQKKINILFVSVLLYEDYEMLLKLRGRKYTANDDDILMICRYSSNTFFGRFIEFAIQEKALKEDTIIHILQNTEHYLNHRTSAVLVAWVKSLIAENKLTQLDILMEVISIRCDPKIYSDILLLKEQSTRLLSDDIKQINLCMNNLKLRIALRQAVRKTIEQR